MDISITINTFTNRFGIDEGCRMVKEAGFEAVDWSLAVWNSGLLRKSNGFPLPRRIFLIKIWMKLLHIISQWLTH